MIQPENIDLVYVVLASVGDEQFTKVHLPQDPVQILDPMSFQRERSYLPSVGSRIRDDALH